jgi:hypothetical protein
MVMRKIFKLFFIIGLLAQPSITFAKEGHVKPNPYPPIKTECPYEYSEEKPIVTNFGEGFDNLPLDTPLNIEVGNQKYKIPAAYIAMWPSLYESNMPSHTGLMFKVPGFKLEEVNKRDSISIAFWMPSLRYLEISTFFLPIRQRCENGRPPPDFTKEYNVTVVIREMNNTPLESWKERVDSSYKVKNKLIKIDEEFGLTKYEHQSNPNQKIYLRNKTDASPQVWISCYKPEAEIIHHCDGVVYFPENNNYFNIKFPAYHLADWKKILESTNQLLQQWKYKN